MKKGRFDFERLMDDWIIPLAIVAAVVWLAILAFRPAAGPGTEAEPQVTEEPVIVQMYG